MLLNGLVLKSFKDILGYNARYFLGSWFMLGSLGGKYTMYTMPISFFCIYVVLFGKSAPGGVKTPALVST